MVSGKGEQGGREGPGKGQKGELKAGWGGDGWVGRGRGCTGSEVVRRPRQGV